MSIKRLVRLLAEFAGTFALTAVVLSVQKTYGTPLFTTIAAAAALAGLYAVLAPVSGGHFNPAVTIGMFVIRKVSLLKAVSYIVVQAAGALIAWKVFEQLSPDRPVTLSATEFNYEVFIAEIIGSIIFAFGYGAVILRRYSGGFAGAAIGLAYFTGSVATSVVIVNRQIVSGILNPAVAMGIGFRPENISYLAYFAGPVIGLTLGLILYRVLFMKVDDTTAKPAFVPVSPASTVETRATSAKAVKATTTKKTTKQATAAKKTTAKSPKRAASKRSTTRQKK